MPALELDNNYRTALDGFTVPPTSLSRISFTRQVTVKPLPINREQRKGKRGQRFSPFFPLECAWREGAPARVFAPSFSVLGNSDLPATAAWLTLGYTLQTGPVD